MTLSERLRIKANKLYGDGPARCLEGEAAAEIDRLTARLEEESQNAYRHLQGMNAALDRAEAAAAEATRLKARVGELAKYTSHFTDCYTWRAWKPGRMEDCTCGLSTTLKERGT